MSNPNQPAPDPAQTTTQGGGMSQGGPSAQTVSSAGGDVKQMRVDDLINLANQQNLDVSALNDLLSKIQVSPEVNVAGQAQGQQGGGERAQGQ
ncbi:MAG TPA: hypothetical protein VFI41_05020 [Gemmatimonadales bacterium]|nr:hypothetical protein [Gemmatimonadales bacterium]